jgi:hypothetical protein
MAKLNRERKLVERRHAKQLKKDARKQAASAATEDLPGGSAPAEDSVGADSSAEDEVAVVASQQVAPAATE